MIDVEGYPSNEEMNDFFVDQFLAKGLVFLISKDHNTNTMVQAAKREIEKQLKKGDWDALDYLVLQLQTECVCFALNKESSNIPDSKFFYRAISDKEYYNAMCKISEKEEEELNKRKKEMELKKNQIAPLPF